MPIVAVFEFPGEEIAKYHNVFKTGGPAITDQPKRSYHVCYLTDGGFTVVDVWEDEGAFADFGEIIGPAAAQAGLDAKPRVHRVEGIITDDGAWTTY